MKKRLLWLLCLTALLCACHRTTLPTAPPQTTLAPLPTTGSLQTAAPEPADHELVAVTDKP